MSGPSTSANQGHALPSLEDIVARITSDTNYPALSQYLKSFTNKEARESVLAGALPDNVDPLTVLDPHTHTLGYLFILYVAPRPAPLLLRSA